MDITQAIDQLYEDLSPGTRVQVADGREGKVVGGKGRNVNPRSPSYDPQRQVLVNVGGRVKAFRKNDVKTFDDKGKVMEAQDNSVSGWDEREGGFTRDLGAAMEEWKTLASQPSPEDPDERRARAHKLNRLQLIMCGLPGDEVAKLRDEQLIGKLHGMAESGVAKSGEKQQSMFMKEDKSVEGADLVKDAASDLPDPEKRPDDGGSIYWKDVKKSSKVVKISGSFFVIDGTARHTIYWPGQEAVQASAHLGTLVKNPELKEDEQANDALPDSADEEGGESGGVSAAPDAGLAEGLPDPAQKLAPQEWTVGRLKAEGFTGPDASLATSLFEYGMAWKFDEAGDKDWKFIYRIKGNEGNRVQYFDFGWFAAHLDPRKEFNWIDNDGWASMAEQYGVTVEELLKMPVPMLIYELTNTHGYENIFGTSYHEGIAIKDPHYSDDEPEEEVSLKENEETYPMPPRRITYTISPGRSKLILHADAATQAELKELYKQRKWESDHYVSFTTDDETEALEPVIANSELEYVRPEEMGDLTDAPMLGIRDEQGRVLERWGYMSYAIKSFLEDLMNTGEAVFISGDDEKAPAGTEPTRNVRESLSNPDFLPDPGPGMSPKYEEIMPEAPEEETEFEPDLGDEHLEGRAEADAEEDEDSVANTWRDDREGEYIQINPDGSVWYVAHGRAMEKIHEPGDDAPHTTFQAIRDWSNNQKVFLNVWSVSDHGNVELYDQTGKSYGGLV